MVVRFRVVKMTALFSEAIAYMSSAVRNRVTLARSLHVHSSMRYSAVVLVKSKLIPVNAATTDNLPVGSYEIMIRSMKTLMLRNLILVYQGSWLGT